MDLNEIPIDIFLDLSKAFDTIDHTILLHKLKYYGLEQSTLRLIESYIKNRKQYSGTSLIRSPVGLDKSDLNGEVTILQGANVLFFALPSTIILRD